MTSSDGIIIKLVELTEYKQTQEMTCALQIPEWSLSSLVILICL
jgi:hypothetical protein